MQTTQRKGVSIGSLPVKSIWHARFFLFMPKLRSILSDRASNLSAHVVNPILVLRTIQLPAVVEQPVWQGFLANFFVNPC